MVESREGARLALESRETLRSPANAARNDFDRHVSPERRIAGAVDLAHTTCAEGGDDLKGAGSAYREPEPRREYKSGMV